MNVSYIYTESTIKSCVKSCRHCSRFFAYPAQSDIAANTIAICTVGALSFESRSVYLENACPFFMPAR